MSVLNFFDILALRPNFFDDADIDDRLDKEQIKMSILERCGTLFPLYTHSEMFKTFSDSFFKQRKDIITKLIDSTKFEYNPIDNYDKTEEVHRKYDEKTSNENETKANSTRNNTQQSDVSAFDSDVFQPKEKVTGTLADVDNTTGKGSGASDITEDITTKTRGNIGVTTTQQMIEAERKVVLFNVYNWIAIEFEQHFFICVS